MLHGVLGEHLRRVPDRAGVLGLRAHQLAETLPEARGEQAVDDRVDRRAEVEEDTRQQVDVLVDVVHQVRPLSDGAPQEPLDVEGRPAHSKRRHHDSCRGEAKRRRSFRKQSLTIEAKHLFPQHSRFTGGLNCEDGRLKEPVAPKGSKGSFVEIFISSTLLFFNLR